jgi:hypothetical protein
LAVKYYLPNGGGIPGGDAGKQQYWLGAGIKVVRAFKGHVPELLKPNERALANLISADGAPTDFVQALASVILTCSNTGAIKLTPDQLFSVQESTGTVTP